MARTRKNFSLSDEAIAAIDAEAERTHATASAALESIVLRDAARLGGSDPDAPAAEVEQLKERVGDLKGQLAEKDAQIRSLHVIAQQAQAVSMATVQRLAPPDGQPETGAAEAATGARSDAETAPGKVPLRTRIARWIAGER